MLLVDDQGLASMETAMLAGCLTRHAALVRHSILSHCPRDYIICL